MIPTRERWDSLVLSRFGFKQYEDAMIFCVFIFTFCLEPTGKEELDENDFCHYFGNFFESTILKLLDHISTFFRNSYKTL